MILFLHPLRMIASLLGVYAQTSNKKAITILDWHTRSAREAITATAKSMIDLGIIN